MVTKNTCFKYVVHLFINYFSKYSREFLEFDLEFLIMAYRWERWTVGEHYNFKWFTVPQTYLVTDI